MIALQTSDDWLTPFIRNSNVRANLDAIAWHYYPLWSGPGSDGQLRTGTDRSNTLRPEHMLQEHADDWLVSGLDYPTIAVPMMRAGAQ